jgi:hypothetical protein
MTRLSESRTTVLRGGAAVAVAAALTFLSAHIAAATPVDTPFPIPAAGLMPPDPIWRTPGPAGGWIIARTDPSSPGITHFVAIGMGCGACVVHWRNLSTGDVGDDFAYVHPTSPAVTGSGVLVATVSIAGASPLTILPGAGAWTVP